MLAKFKGLQEFNIYLKMFSVFAPTFHPAQSNMLLQHFGEHRLFYPSPMELRDDGAQEELLLERTVPRRWKLLYDLKVTYTCLGVLQI